MRGGREVPVWLARDGLVALLIGIGLYLLGSLIMSAIESGNIVLPEEEIIGVAGVIYFSMYLVGFSIFLTVVAILWRAALRYGVRAPLARTVAAGRATLRWSIWMVLMLALWAVQAVAAVGRHRQD